MTNKSNLDGVRHVSSEFHRFLKAENSQYLFVYGYTLFLRELDFGKYFYALSVSVSSNFVDSEEAEEFISCSFVIKENGKFKTAVKRYEEVFLFVALYGK